MHPEVFNAIQSLHDHFEGWLGENEEKTSVHIQFIEAAFDHSFFMVTAEGVIQSRDEVLSGLKKARGKLPGIRIQIDQFKVLQEDHLSAVAIYRETQVVKDQVNRRMSTALFKKIQGEWMWAFVQETMIAIPD